MNSYLHIKIIAVLRYPAPVPYATVSLSFVAFSKKSICSFQVFHFFFYFVCLFVVVCFTLPELILTLNQKTNGVK